MSNPLSRLGSIAGMVISLAICAFYLSAFFDGARIWFGWEGWWVAIVGILTMVMLGPLGTIVISIIGGYGAYYSWDWHWLACTVVFFPGFAGMIGYIVYGATSRLLFRQRGAL